MFQHTWLQKLHQLNSKLRVCQFESSNHLPGIYYVDSREGITDICATDIGWVPPYSQFTPDGRMIKSGYRRIIFILLHLKLVTKDKIRSLWPSFFEQRMPELSSAQSTSLHQRWAEMMAEERKRFSIIGDAKQVDVQDKIVDKMKHMELENYNIRKSAALSGDQYVELAESIKKDMPDEKRESLERAKFDYDKAVGKRKSLI